jgi:HEPN domain-containing protein
MNKEEIIRYWIDSSDCDFKTMKHLFDSKDYTWALFIGHLVIEKLAKAYYVKTIDNCIPFSHNLIFILSKTGVVLEEKKSDLLSDLNTFNIAARYDDYKQAF